MLPVAKLHIFTTGKKKTKGIEKLLLCEDDSFPNDKVHFGDEL